jgi:hypothetical protein
VRGEAGYEGRMTEARVTLAAAAFMDSAHAAHIDTASTEHIRTIARRFLQVSYQELGKPPNELDGQDLQAALCEHLPRHFGKKDPLALSVPGVLAALLDFLDDTAVVSHRFELRQALAAHSDAFVAAVASGAAHLDGVAITERGKTFVHRAQKTGRNDPCPCGSGKKLKKCCGS